MRMSRLAVLANSELSRLSHLMSRLEKRGFVRREHPTQPTAASPTRSSLRSGTATSSRRPPDTSRKSAASSSKPSTPPNSTPSATQPERSPRNSTTAPVSRPPTSPESQSNALIEHGKSSSVAQAAVRRPDKSPRSARFTPMCTERLDRGGAGSRCFVANRMTNPVEPHGGVSAARVGDSFVGPLVTVLVMFNSYSTGVNRPSATCRRPGGRPRSIQVTTTIRSSSRVVQGRRSRTFFCSRPNIPSRCRRPSPGHAGLSES